MVAQNEVAGYARDGGKNAKINLSICGFRSSIVAPQATDPEIDQRWTTTLPGSNPTAPTNKLFVFLPGFAGVPSETQLV